jgi:hypothetical protein
MKDFMKKLCVALFLSLIVVNTYAKSINVYLQFEDPALSHSIQAFNDYLENNGIFSRYQLEPFLKHYPLHITLFLATYPETHIEAINQRIRALAQHWDPISINTTQLFVTAGNYVMLDVDNANLPDGQNPALQQLSDAITLKLTGLRDFNAKIPDWAESIPEKRKAFMRYGSPGVFVEYSPHFTLMTKNFNDPAQAKQFQKEMNHLIKTWSFSSVSTTSAVIAIGYVDEFGQITKEIARFSLRKIHHKR